MTERTKAALAAHLRACGRDGPPPGAGPWVIEWALGVDVVDLQDGGGGWSIRGALTVADVARITRHAPLLPEPMEVQP